MDYVVKVSDNLQDIVLKLNEAHSKVGEALTIYIGVFNELVTNGYEGTAVQPLAAYYELIYAHLQSLIELYSKISTYISYVHESMNELDGEMAVQIGAAFTVLGSKGVK